MNHMRIPEHASLLQNAMSFMQIAIATVISDQNKFHGANYVYYCNNELKVYGYFTKYMTYVRTYIRTYAHTYVHKCVVVCMYVCILQCVINQIAYKSITDLSHSLAIFQYHIYYRN